MNNVRAYNENFYIFLLGVTIFTTKVSLCTNSFIIICFSFLESYYRQSSSLKFENPVLGLKINKWVCCGPMCYGNGDISKEGGGKRYIFYQ